MIVSVFWCQLVCLKGRHYIHRGAEPNGGAPGSIVATAPEKNICVNRSDSVRKCVSQMECLAYTSEPIDRKKCGRVIEPQTLLTLPEWCRVVSNDKVVLLERLLLVGGVGESGIVVLGIGVRWSRGVFRSTRELVVDQDVPGFVRHTASTSRQCRNPCVSCCSVP